MWETKTFYKMQYGDEPGVGDFYCTARVKRDRESDLESVASNRRKWSGMLSQMCNASTPEAKTGGSNAWCKPRVQTRAEDMAVIVCI